MRRFLSLLVVLCVAAPFGASMAGCGHKSVTVVYCNGLDSGPTVGAVKSIELAPTLAIYGESLNYGQIGSALSATALDCRGNQVSVSSYVFASTDTNRVFADINPASGQVCAGSWNRNSGGGIPDYTTCTAPVVPSSQYVAYVTATAQGAVSNAVPVYVHPVVTGVVIGTATPQASCATAVANGGDPSTNCCPAYTQSSVTAPPYAGNSCVSQNASVQLTARIYQNGTTNPADNITCQSGHVFYTAQSSSIFSVDENGIATAHAPGSTEVDASVANSGTGGSAAGYFATCPPASIVLTAPDAVGNTLSVNVNNSEPLQTTVLDTQGNPITGANLEFNSTSPTTIPASVGSVTPIYPGTATITAVCQPQSCNPSPFSQIGLYGNGKPITSNGINVVVGGRSASVVYLASTNSRYFFPVDFSTGQPGKPVQLPYVPNSMVISQSGTALYFGSAQALMIVSTGNNAIASSVTTVPGTVLAISPDSATLVVADPTRQTVSLVTSGGQVQSVYGGLGTRAQFTPDGQTVYITAGNQLLVHSSFTGWMSFPLTTNYRDVTVTVPSVGAFFGGSLTEARSQCPSTTASVGGPPAVETNTFYPVASDTAVTNDRVAATNNGLHVLGATVTPTGGVLNDIATTIPVGSCPTIVPPTYFTTSFTTQPFAGVVPTTITGVIPASNSALAFVTYLGSGGKVPLYMPAATGAGTLTYVPLTNGATAPASGVFATDNLTFFTGTSGDGALHLLTLVNGVWTDSSFINVALPAVNGASPATPDLIAQQPKRTSS